METRRYSVVGVWAAVVAGALAGCASGGAGVANDRRVVDARQWSARPGDSVQVGYGMQDRRRMTGSVASVSGDVVKSQHMTRVEDLLMRVSGVVVSPRSDGTYSITVRGATTLSPYTSATPLFVIDGMPVLDGLGALRSISPEDVERIDVIKDAEASIYGSRSANGVILVRTRHARLSRD